jgi:ATP-dependent Lon protease
MMAISDPGTAPSVSGSPGDQHMAIESVPLPSDALILVPVRNTVLFPGIIFPVSIG